MEPLMIERILMSQCDQLKRDEDGTIVYDGQLRTIADNLLHHNAVQSSFYSSYEDFFTALLNNTPSNAPWNGTPQKNMYGMPIPPESVHSISEVRKSSKPYVNSVITRPTYQSWKPGDSIFISAGTGRGKNTFLSKELLQHLGNNKAVIFENRKALLQQQLLDFVHEIDQNALKYYDFSDDSFHIIGPCRNIMLVSYQTAAKMCMTQNQHFLSFCQCAKYLVFDEAHYMLDDSSFNKGINYYLRYFLNNGIFQNSIKLYLSGTMEEFYAFIQRYASLKNTPQLLDTLNENNYAENTINRFNGNQVRILSMPADYHYLRPFKYRSLQDIGNQIVASPLDEKWLVFVRSINDGYNLLSLLQHDLGDAVKFFHSGNVNERENKSTYDFLIHKSKYECRVLIATNVLYNGINIKDPALKHIVLPFSTIPVLKQLIGRKRVEPGETVNVYFHDVDTAEITKNYIQCIKDHFQLIELRRILPHKAFLELNGVTGFEPSNYYFMTLRTIIQGNNRSQFFLPELNVPAIFKLFCDTCFYIYLLQRINDVSNATNPIQILLQHLGIGEMIIQEISPQSTKTKVDNLTSELVELLEQLISAPLTIPDENGSENIFVDLKRLLNEAYKALHDGENIDSHWKESQRFFEKEKLSAFLVEIRLPYKITYKKSKGVGNLKVERRTDGL